MSYEIVKDAPPVPASRGGLARSKEREAMEALLIGDAIYVADDALAKRAHYIRYQLKPRKFTVRKVPGTAKWQVRRVE